MRDHSQLFERMMQPADGLTMVRRVLTALWLSVCLIQVGVWAMIWVIGGELQPPWWLWTLCGGGVVVGAVWLVTRSLGTKR